MPRGKEPSWPVQKMIFDLLVRHGDQPSVIQRSLDALISQKGLVEGTPGLKWIERTVEKLQELELDVLAELPQSVWKRRRDYEAIKDELERLAGRAGQGMVIHDPQSMLRQVEEAIELEGTEHRGGRVSPRIRQLEGLYDVAVRLDLAFSRLSAKDWAVWELPEAPWLPYRPNAPSEESPAELRAGIERGKLWVRLLVEEDKRFPLLLMQLQGITSEFATFEEWKRGLVELVSNCQEICREIWHRTEGQTRLKMSVFDPGHGLLLNVPLFIYEFALDNHASKRLPRLVMSPHDNLRYKLTPETRAQYVLAIGSEAEMASCRQTTTYLCSQYARDTRIGMIKEKEARVRKDAEPFTRILSQILAPFRSS